jgi:hypothetical protein
LNINRKLERTIVGIFLTLGLAWALITIDFHAFEFKLDYLISLSSLLTVASFSVRDMLPLRTLAVASQIIAIPYFLLQPTPLWTPAGWTMLFMVINFYHIARILLERRPVRLNPEEQRLYELAFQRLGPREFLKLAKLGEWKNGKQGEHIFDRGKPIEQILIPISGTVEASQDGTVVAQLQPGDVIGTGIALSGQTSLYSADFAQDSRYMSWRVSDIARFRDRNPDLATKFNDIVNHYLIAQINKLTFSIVNEESL